MNKFLILVLLAGIPLFSAAQPPENEVPMLEIRRVVYDIKDGTPIGVIDGASMGEEIRLDRGAHMLYGIPFKRDNDLYEESLKETMGRAFINLDYRVQGFGNLFSELRASQSPDYALGFLMDSLVFNYKFYNFRYKLFHSKTYVSLQMLDLNLNKIVLDTSFVSEYFSSEQGHSAENQNLRNYLDRSIEKVAREVSVSDAFQAIIKGYSDGKYNVVSGDTVYLKPSAPLRDRESELRKAIESTVTIKSGNRHGSGAVISDDGLILTCDHVVKGNEEVRVILSNNMEVGGNVISQNSEYDVALVKIDDIVTRPLKINAEYSPTLMETVWVVGTPTATQLGQSITKGVVSGNRLIEGKEYIQTDAGISPGNSGGPMLSDKGDFLGIVNAKVVGEGVESLGFAIPIDVALRKLNVIIE